MIIAVGLFGLYLLFKAYHYLQRSLTFTYTQNPNGYFILFFLFPFFFAKSICGCNFTIGKPTLDLFTYYYSSTRNRFFSLFFLSFFFLIEKVLYVSEEELKEIKNRYKTRKFYINPPLQFQKTFLG